MTTTCKLADMNNMISGSGNTFICCASFESRCRSIPEAIERNKIAAAYVFVDKEYDNHSEGNKGALSALFGADAFVETSTEKPVHTASNISQTIKGIVKSGNKNLIIDITTFTHEMLLMIIKLIYEYREKFEKVTCLYNEAERYSVGDTIEEMWLTKGCRILRNVIGYSGQLYPNVPTCLILLAGFEHERATSIIDMLDPEKLQIGQSIDEDASDELQKVMKHFQGKLRASMVARTECEYFDFHCKDVDATVKEVGSSIEKYADHNHNTIIIPLNTKLSTIASAIVALKNRRIQLCYSVPETYNFEKYSSASDKVTHVDLKSYFSTIEFHK
ncbi:MAG: hypothetical protein FWG42_00445 [Clostridiales bacterium]|nr:hypothetical protein [Clostridiales bacterium]